jgi:hypothetical protein
MILQGRFATILATPRFAALLLITASAETTELAPEAGKAVVIMG